MTSLPRRAALSSALALALTAAAAPSFAQSSAATSAAPSQQQQQRRRAFVLNGGPMIGFLGGAYARGSLEVQLHSGPRYEGHALNVSLGGAYWPNLGGASVTAGARYQYDLRLVEGTQFFLAPFVGMELGVAIVANKMALAGVRVAVLPVAGLELKFVLDRLVLGFRPLGVLAPVFIGEPQRSGIPVQWDLLWDVSFTLGVTF